MNERVSRRRGNYLSSTFFHLCHVFWSSFLLTTGRYPWIPGVFLLLFSFLARLLSCSNLFANAISLVHFRSLLSLVNFFACLSGPWLSGCELLDNSGPGFAQISARVSSCPGPSSGVINHLDSDPGGFGLDDLFFNLRFQRSFSPSLLHQEHAICTCLMPYF